MITHKCAFSAGEVVTESFKREMTRPVGAPAKLYAPMAHKYDGVGGYAAGSGPIPIAACLGAAASVIGAVACVWLLLAAGFY